jgi:hypothetical protein
MTGLSQHTVSELVELFVVIALAEDEALLYDDVPKFNELFSELSAVKKELKARDGDQRRALIGLYSHKNAQVRLMAAKATLAVEPEQARGLLEALASSHEFPQAGDAGMTLLALDEGIFKPT